MKHKRPQVICFKQLVITISILIFFLPLTAAFSRAELPCCRTSHCIAALRPELRLSQARKDTFLFATPGDGTSKLRRRDFIGISIISAFMTSANLANSLVNDETSGLSVASAPTPDLPMKKPRSDKNDRLTTVFQESISGFISGTTVSTVKTLIKYPLDTATVRLQMPGTEFSPKNLRALFKDSFQGISAPLLFNIPAGAVFFAVKDATRSALKGFGLLKWESTTIAVAMALPPYWLIRNPSEVVKTRLQVGANGYYKGMKMSDAFKLTLSGDSLGCNNTTGVRAFYQGYSENVLYGFPADIIKFVTYDYLSGGRKIVTPKDGAFYGALSTAVAQLLTTPLDVVRNRVMAEATTSSQKEQSNAIVVEGKQSSYVARLMKIFYDEGLRGLFAGSSPRIAKAILSGAIQFATYEETKNEIRNLFLK